MQLRTKTVLNYLQNKLDIVKIYNPDTDNKLQGVLLYEQDMEMEPGWIYVFGKDTALPARRLIPGGVLLILLKDPKGNVHENVTTVVMGGMVREETALNTCIRCYEYYFRWQRQLNDISEEQGSIEDLLEISEPVIGNPLCVMRSDLSTAASGLKFRRLDPFGRLRDSENRVRSINRILQDPDYNIKKYSKDCYEGPADVLGLRTINYNLKMTGEITYVLTAAEVNPFSGSEPDLLPFLGHYLRKSINISGGLMPWREENLHKLLGRILSDRTLDYMTASDQLSELGWHKEDEYLCLTFYLNYLDRNSMPVTSVCNYVEDMFPGAASFPYEDSVVSFFNLTKLGMDRSLLSSKLTPFIRDGNLKAGYSRVVKGHMNLRRQYLQTVIALEVGARKDPYNWIHQFDQVAMTYILEQATKTIPGEMLCHEGVLKLKALDELNGSDYIKTLKTFLDNHQNVVHTANTLYIHRSTLLYRLEKIKEAIGSELTDPEELLYIGISMRLL